MKRVGNLYPQIYAFENLYLGFKKARRGKKRTHANAAFEVNLEKELFKLQDELKGQHYCPGNYTTFKIYDPKERMISAAPFRDRVVHHALCNIIEPIFDATLIYDTYANRKGKGTHAGIRRCQYFARQYKYVLKADIRKYFPSIDHSILKELIRKKIKCQPTLALIDKIIDYSNPQELVPDYFPGDTLFTLVERKKGLPMGNLTSQFLANIYLSPFDHFIKDKCGIKGYVRYVDDSVIFHDDKAYLHLLKQEAQHFLQKTLRLNLHPKKTQIFPTKTGINFLGQRVFHSHRKLNKQNVHRFNKRLEKRLALYRSGQLTVDQFECQLNSWLGHAKQADTFLLRKKIFNYLVFKKGLHLFETDRFAWRLLEQQR